MTSPKNAYDKLRVRRAAARLDEIKKQLNIPEHIHGPGFRLEQKKALAGLESEIIDDIRLKKKKRPKKSPPPPPPQPPKKLKSALRKGKGKSKGAKKKVSFK